MLVDCDGLYGKVISCYPTVGGAVRHDRYAGILCFHFFDDATRCVYDFGTCDYYLYRGSAKLRCIWVGESMGGTTVGGGIFSVEVGDILEYRYWLGACDRSWG